jgi:phospholipid-transporting ATPase
VPEKNEEGNGEEINFQAASPDEGALVRGTAKNGFLFHTRRPTEIIINTVKHQIYNEEIVHFFNWITSFNLTLLQITNNNIPNTDI